MKCKIYVRMLCFFNTKVTLKDIFLHMKVESELQENNKEQ